MIILDANVWVALVDEEDALNARVLNDISRLRRGPMRTIESALSEACHLCTGELFLERLVEIMEQLNVTPLEENLRPRWRDIFQWMVKYKSHQPDWTDAELAVISSHHSHVRIWTYDKEFRTIWRRIDGTKIPLAVDSTR
jgi:predicted nucleic acid-binding protein